MTRHALVLFLAAIFSWALVPPVAARADVVPPQATEEEQEAEKADAAEKNDADEDKDGEEAAADAAATGDQPAASQPQSDEAKPAAQEASDEKKADQPEEKADEKTDAKKAEKKRKTHKVEPKRLKVDVSLEGVFVAREMAEVPLRPEAWTDYEIVEVVKHGAKVRAGEVLFKFDDRKLNEAIADLELEQRLNELAILRAEDELPRMEKTLKMNFDDAERASREAKEDFDRYQEIDRPMAVKSAEFMVKYYEFMLNYEQDELDQLEKMYKADDLTEETEEIVLKRQRNSVEFAEFSLENAKQNRDEVLKVRLPRFDIQIKDALERTALALAGARMALSLDLNRARYELEQRKQSRTKSLDRHGKLLVDRGLMEIKSPADGIVYYGQCVNGRWAETPSLISKYKPHNNVSPDSIPATVVQSRPVYVTSTVDEAKRPELADGQKAKLILPAEGSDRVGSELKSISLIPVSPGKFEVNIEVDQGKLPEWVVPGMTCKVRVNTYDKKEALVVPKAALHTDEYDEDQSYVWLVDPDDEEAKPERRDVKLGKRSGDDVEIVEGLKEGDVVSLEDETKKAKEKE